MMRFIWYPINQSSHYISYKITDVTLLLTLGHRFNLRH